MYSEKLLPCPCCASSAHLETMEVRKGYEADIHCNGCQLSYHTTTFLTEEDAIKDVVTHWNQRKSPKNDWIPYYGQILEEGEYVVTLDDSVVPEDCPDMKVRMLRFYEKSGAFAGYGKGANSKVIAYKPKEKPYIPDPCDVRYCCSCKWYTLEEGVCVNSISEHRADFCCLDDFCECWEPKKED